MNYKKLCKKYLPNVDVLYDFSKSKYVLTPAQKAILSQKEIMRIEDLRQEEFSAVRQKFGLSYGGSDVPIILGKGFIPKSVLAAQKRNPALKPKIDDATKELFWTGHRAEESIMELFEIVSGKRAIPWPLMMRNKKKYPHFLMNIDGLFFEEKMICLYEGKWSQSYQIIRDHWRKARDLRKDGIEPWPTVSPEKYILQTWAYLAGLEIDKGVICGGWGYAKNEIGYIYIPRLPADKEKEMMETCEMFMDLVASGETITDEEFDNKLKLHDLYRKLHAQMVDSGTPVVFDPKDMDAAKRFLELQERTKELKLMLDSEIAQIKEEFEEREHLADLEAEKLSIQTFFEGRMGGDCTGVINDGKETATVHWDAKTPRRTFDKKKCEEEFPEVFKQVYTGTPTKTFSITIEDTEGKGGPKK